MTPVHYAAMSVGSSLFAAVSFAVDGPTVTAIVAAAITMSGAVLKTWRASVAAAARTQALEVQVKDQERQMQELRAMVARQADIIQAFAGDGK